MDLTCAVLVALPVAVVAWAVLAIPAAVAEQRRHPMSLRSWLGIR